MDSYTGTMSVIYATVMDVLPNQCPDKHPKEIIIAMIGVMLIQNYDVINKTWTLLDTFSTDSVTKKFYSVEDVKNCAKHEELKVLTNGVSLLFDQKLRLTFLPLNVHVNENSLAAILYFKDVNNIPGVPVTMDISI